MLRLPPRSYTLHHLVQLGNLVIAHLVELGGVEPLAAPGIALKLLRVQLPLGQEAHDVHGVVNGAVKPELALDVLVAQHAHRGRQSLPVRAE